MNKETLKELNDLSQTIEQMEEFMKKTPSDLMGDIRFGNEYNSPFKGIQIHSYAFSKRIVHTLRNNFKDILPRLKEQFKRMSLEENK